MKKIRIAFVCHGNICRSPMAEFIMKKLVSDMGVEEKFLIVSRATSTEEIWGGVGSPIHPSAKNQLRIHSVPYSEREATLLLKSDTDKYDYFVGMDDINVRNMRRILNMPEAQFKIKKLKDYTDTPGDVSDPWYTRNFDLAYADIFEGCKRFLDFLLENS